MKKIKGYKGFDKDMKCRDFQFEVGKEYHQDGMIKACGNGFHFCEDPLDTFNYYPLIGGNVYAEVEGSGESDRQKDGDSKVAVENIRIVTKLDLPALITASVEFIWDKASKKSVFKKRTATTGERAHSATTGERAHSATTGKRAHSATTGERAHSATTGNYANSATTGNGAHSATTGNDAHSATTGNYANSATTGNDAHSATTGNYAHSATTGERANSATTGYGAHSATTTKDSIACAIGRKAKAKASLGCFIVLAEWEEGESFTDAKPLAVKSAKVDGKKIKADQWYKLVEGKFIETDDSNE